MMTKKHFVWGLLLCLFSTTVAFSKTLLPHSQLAIDPSSIEFVQSVKTERGLDVSFRIKFEAMNGCQEISHLECLIPSDDGKCHNLSFGTVAKPIPPDQMCNMAIVWKTGIAHVRLPLPHEDRPVFFRVLKKIPKHQYLPPLQNYYIFRFDGQEIKYIVQDFPANPY